MKKFIFKYAAVFMVVSAGCAFLFSCNKKDYLVNASYPAPVIYMPEAAIATLGSNANGVYYITPNIENQPHRFTADVAGAKLNIPLGIIRSGVNPGGAYSVNIAVNNDTVTKLIAASKFAVPTDTSLTTVLLPASAYTLPSSVNLGDGSTNASFTLSVDLNFLTASFTNTPKKRYAVAVGIVSSDKTSAVKASLATTVVFIDPRQIFLPVANFISYIYKETRTANFLNTSSNTVTYSWNFGDSTTAVTDISPSHIYAAAGSYTVSVTATGITGSADASVKTTTIVIQ